MNEHSPATVTIAASLAGVAPEAWDACAIPDDATMNPFVSHAFLKALEDAGCVGGRSGWAPQYLLLNGAGGQVMGCLPAYLKRHSQGEYVFDHGWAEAYERAGGRYYPKLQVAVPFSPVPGPRLLVRPGPLAQHHAKLLGAALVEVTRQNNLSSAHVTFCREDEWATLAGLDFLKRTDQQFHWHNRGYGTFDDFLGALSSRKRKAIRKEREQATAAGLDVSCLRGSEITSAHWDAFFAFYMDTGSRKWGRPYLNRKFFTLLGATMTDRCLLILATRSGKPVAGALNLIGGDCLYGRYWGAIEHHPCLHFELCYYQAIDYAIRHRIPRVEAGAQGDHKLARGYMPCATFSAHWIADPGLRRAVARYLDEERRAVAEHREILAEYGPYRKTIEEHD